MAVLNDGYLEYKINNDEYIEQQIHRTWNDTNKACSQNYIHKHV